MTIKVAVEHRTTYRFDRPVALGPHVVRLRPAPHTRTPVSAYSLRVTPADHFLNWQQDPYGNHLARLVFPERTTELEIVVDLVADLTVINPFDFFLEEDAATVPFGYDAALAAGPRGLPARPGRGRSTGGAGLDRRARAGARRRRAHRRLPGPAQPAVGAGRALHGADGAGRPHAGRDPRAGQWLVPRLGLAARRGAARARPGGPLRVRLPDPAGARRRPRRPGRARADRGLHRPARVGRGVPARAPAGSAWTRPPG